MLPRHLARSLALALALAACGSSGSTPAADAPASGDGGACPACGMACSVGNELGVGRHCTKGGGECSANGAPFFFCTVDFDQTAPDAFCTGSCAKDADCGTGAYCNGQGGQMGCVPASCGGTPSVDAGA